MRVDIPLEAQFFFDLPLLLKDNNITTCFFESIDYCQNHTIMVDRLLSSMLEAH